MTPTDYFYAAIRETPKGKAVSRRKIRMRIRDLSDEAKELVFRRCVRAKDFYAAFLRHTRR